MTGLRYYATKAHGVFPTVWCGEIDGPNVTEVRRTRTMVGARLMAWILNRKTA